MSSIYERELKAILTGDGKVIKRYNGLYNLTIENPFLVVRAAGSLGVDLVAIRGDIAFPIEVKSTQTEKIHFSSSCGANQKQAEAFRTLCNRANVMPIYAVRIKHFRNGVDPWRLFRLPSVRNPKGFASIISEVLPVIEKTKNRNFTLNWSEGLKLSDFMELCCHEE